MTDSYNTREQRPVVAPIRRLGDFDGAGYDKGRPIVFQALWLAASHLLVQPWWAPSALRIIALRFFGAEIGSGVVIRQRVRVHWPWKLVIGSDSWIGEGVWLLNLEPITIGSNVCVSQEAALFTGSHVHADPRFRYDNAPVVVESDAWICARALVLRGVTVGRGRVVPAGVCQRVSLPPALLPAPAATSGAFEEDTT